MGTKGFFSGSKGSGKIWLSLVALIVSMLAFAAVGAENRTSATTGSDQPDAVKASRADGGGQILSVATVRRSKDGERTEVLFNESERIFQVGAAGRGATDVLPELQNALKNDQPLLVRVDPMQDRIISVAKPSEADIKSFRQSRKAVLRADKPRMVDLKEIEAADPHEFNKIEKLKIPLTKKCLPIIPSYAKAKEIFDFCAKQSCNLPGPYDISPCIPFQYVRDGCYARAHKMARIIRRYGYCSNKVFSFANQDMDTLAVVASKWGGCCVTWWYHVAPLVKVDTYRVIRGKKVKFTLAYVIDPGMFNKPVLLSEWLKAQANTSCQSNAKVSTYSIQPASAYAPANYAGTAFSTDPTLSLTDNTLLNYQNLQTCN